MAIDQQRWEPESPFTELEEGAYMPSQLETDFGEDEVERPIALRVNALPSVRQWPGRVYVKITGRSQGDFAGDSRSASHENWLAATGFDYELKVPRITATGLAAGRREHGPVTLTLPWGPASPQIFQAAVTNEPLLKVVFEFPALGRDGSEVVAERITLTDALVTAYRHLADPAASLAPIDRVSFTFRRIAIDDLVSGRRAEDDWAFGQKEAEAAESWEGESWEAETYEIDGADVRRTGADGFA